MGIEDGDPVIHATLVRGPYEVTSPHHAELKRRGFVWNPEHRAWIGPFLPVAERKVLDRKLCSASAEVRLVRKDLVSQTEAS
jgi:hypothetical protein